VNYLKQQGKARGITVVNVAEAPLANSPQVGCGCATMSRNDPPHLVALLDILRQGKTLPYNVVKAGDVVNEFTGLRNRLSDKEQQWVIDNAKIALENMIRITESR
ncbi:MAG TPA: quinolinate synthase NadA, partial [Legionellales bacterium]|nr:quinolinate synthase NadA [Legionellales bacterium]